MARNGYSVTWRSMAFGWALAASSVSGRSWAYAASKRGGSGAKTGELCRSHGMSEGTFYKWKAKYAGLTLNEVKRLRSVEEENRRLKQIVAQQALDNWSLKELLAKNF